MATIKMPFGKYRGKRIISVPAEYLHWLLDNSEEMDADLRRAVEQELDRRGEPHAETKAEPEVKPAKKPKAESPAVEGKQVSALGQRLAGDVRMLFRNLALKYHPDRGGSQDAMQALNELHDQVQELLTRTFSS